MELIAHRINTIRELAELSPEYGVELDLRDGIDGRIYIQHEPFLSGEDFEAYLKKYHHGRVIANIKSERIEWQARALLQRYGVEKYFFLDSTFPMIKLLTEEGEKNIALRYSEFEGMDTLEAMAGKVDWVWVDCFTCFPLTKPDYDKMKAMGYKICIVSPELEGQPEKITAYRDLIKERGICPEAVCTKVYEMKKWR